MEWKDFIQPIQKSGITSDAAYKIVLDIFEQAGSKDDISAAAAKSWLNGSRNCKASTYFPAGKADTASLFRYFRRRPDGKLRQLQQMFLSGKLLEADSPIDVKTDDIEVFCWSLVNQFLDLLGLQRVDIPHTDTPAETPVTETSQLHSQRSDIPKDEKQSQTQDAPCSSHSISGTDISSTRKHSIWSTILPHSDDCCYHCVYWEGNRQTFGAYTTPTYGICLKYNRQEQLSSDLACKDYEKRQKLSGDW